MSMREVAKLAGVSMSTVSRVVNVHPNIAHATARSVHEAMATLKFTPSVRRPSRQAPLNGTARNTAIGFLVFGSSGMQVAPAFQKLLRGVSDAAAEAELNLVFGFANGEDDLPPRIAGGQVDGLLLHGKRPSAAFQERLSRLPSVWLMANPQRPAWGDQVMPNNPVIGEMAARYLAGLGHRHLACLKAAVDGWSLRLRAWSFAEASVEMGATAKIIEATENSSIDLWEPNSLGRIAEELVDRLLSLTPRPTGVFILEDRLLHSVTATLTERGLRIGPDGDIEILSCNNERPRLPGAQSQPAAIDIQADLIGRQGVRQLLWRMKHRDQKERAFLLVEPTLVHPAAEVEYAVQ